MIIHTERLLVRPVIEEDWQDIQALWAAVAQTEYAKYDSPKDTGADSVRVRIAKWADVSRNGTDHIFFSVCLEETVIGYVSFNIRPGHHEIGYCFHPKFHGQRYAKESLSALIRNITLLGIQRLTARTALNNTPSVALLTSLGFQQTGSESVSFYKDESGKDIVFEGGIFELVAGENNV